jgi:hypothetical protein
MAAREAAKSDPPIEDNAAVFDPQRSGTIRKAPKNEKNEEAASTQLTATQRSKVFRGIESSGPLVLGVDGIRRRAKDIGDLTWFEILGLTDGATPTEIRATYEVLGNIWRPSSLPSELSRARGDVEVVSAHIENAYRMLMSTMEPALAERCDVNAPTRMMPVCFAEAPTRLLVIAPPASTTPARPPGRVSSHDTIIELAVPTCSALMKKKSSDDGP